MNHFRFDHPWALWLLLLIPALAILRGRFGREAAVQYSGLSLLGPLIRQGYVAQAKGQKDRRQRLLACLLVALARPQRVDSTSQVQESGIDIMLAIDLSPSMQALDYFKNGQELSRVDAVRDSVGQFIQDRPNDRIGMVVFAGEAFLMSPLTLDHDWLMQNVSRLQVGLASKAKSRIIVLLTDGANNAGKITPYAAAQAAAALHIKIYTIGAGSAEEAKFPVRDPFTGQMTYTKIPVDIDVDALKKIAQIGGGQFFRAADIDAMNNVYKTINKLETTHMATKRFEHAREFFQYALYPGLFFLGLEIVLSHTRWRRIP